VRNIPLAILCVLLVFATVGSVIATFVAGVGWLSARGCEQRAVSFAEHRWGYLSGCMVLHNGKWLPLDIIRGFDDKGIAG
jgi:hypothetical protein